MPDPVNLADSISCRCPHICAFVIVTCADDVVSLKEVRRHFGRGHPGFNVLDLDGLGGVVENAIGCPDSRVLPEFGSAPIPAVVARLVVPF